MPTETFVKATYILATFEARIFAISGLSQLLLTQFWPNFIVKGWAKKPHESFDKFTCRNIWSRGRKWVPVGKIQFLAFFILWSKVKKLKENMENYVLKKCNFWFSWIVNNTGHKKRLCHLFCLISQATNMLEGSDIFHVKGGISSFIWSTTTFLYDIREPGSKQNNISDTAVIYA